MVPGLTASRARRNERRADPAGPLASRLTLAGLPDDIRCAHAPDGPGASRAMVRMLAGDAGHLQLRHDRLGRPLLSLDGAAGGHVSFSHGQGLTLAAMCEDRPVGIDQAHPAEFGPGYPLARAFAEAEWQEALGLGLEPAPAAALLWSLKEAAVKAAGSGFHLIDPREVRCQRQISPPGISLYHVSAPRPMQAHAFYWRGRYVAVAFQ